MSEPMENLAYDWKPKRLSPEELRSRSERLRREELYLREELYRLQRLERSEERLLRRQRRELELRSEERLLERGEESELSYLELLRLERRSELERLLEESLELESRRLELELLRLELEEERRSELSEESRRRLSLSEESELESRLESLELESRLESLELEEEEESRRRLSLSEESELEEEESRRRSRLRLERTRKICIQAVKNEVRNYIDNQLPIYLLDLKHMHLIHRTTISAYFEADIEKYCRGDKISNPRHYYSKPAYMETLRYDARTWIKDTTGYAIFSHRWGSNELTFSDISQFEKIGHGSDKSTDTINSKFIPKKVTDLAEVPNQMPYAEFGLLAAMTALCDGEDLNDHPSFVKIIRFFTLSRKYNCNFVWFDTGCIDKASSAELDESIRSMFNWYRNSKICIIHLSETSNTMNMRSDPWFTRGWTLQELLAPPRVKFVDSSWTPLLTYIIPFDDNDKLVCDSEQKKYFWKRVFDITHISDEHITNFKPGVHQASDALRWMANRETTRDEDMAYCLIGLLGIPLTIAYGEGMQAFYRLQVEILQHTSDMGLLAWLGRPATKNSMLASEPKCFSSSVAIKSLFSNQILAINGRQLHIKLMTYEVTIREDRTTSEHSKAVMLRIKGLPGQIRVVLQTWDDDVLGSQTLGADNVETQSSDDEGDSVDFQTSKNADKVELAILGRIRKSKPKEYLAILLRTKNGQCKRLSTKQHIRLALPKRKKWPKPTDRYIQ